MKAILKLAVVILVIWGVYRWIYDSPQMQSDVSKIPEVNIEQILDGPTQYEGIVKINGEVTQSMNLLGIKGYEIEDSTGSIPVIPHSNINAVPNEGKEVELRGRVNQIVKAGDEQIIVIRQAKP